MSNKNYLKPLDPNAKYRPTLTALQILTILDLAKTPPLTEDKMSIISTLSPMLAKIQTGAMSAAYTIKEPKGAEERTKELLDSLGASPSPSSPMVSHKNDPNYWLECYNKWLEDSGACSLIEVAASNEHRYLNNLMSPKEIAEFEGAL